MLLLLLFVISLFVGCLFAFGAGAQVGVRLLIEMTIEAVSLTGRRRRCRCRKLGEPLHCSVCSNSC